MSELSGQSQRFGQRLREAVEIALEQGDEDLLTVDVARLFLDKETEEMMDAFRRYCVRSVSFALFVRITSSLFHNNNLRSYLQGEASLLLSSLEKERELLRIFLRASQLENPALRRMDLHAFLMVKNSSICLCVCVYVHSFYLQPIHMFSNFYLCFLNIDDQVPVQRITKYPLLLGRLLRATAQQDVEMREALREAQAKVESYLTAINAVSITKRCSLIF